MVQPAKKFQEKLQDLRDMSRNLRDMLLGKGNRAWGHFKGQPAKSDAIKLHEEFSREELEKQLEELLEGTPGVVGDVAVLKLQSDFLSSLERDYGLRHKSRLRCVAHDAGRRNGYQHENGPLQMLIMSYLQDLIQLIDRSKEDPEK